MPRLILIVVVAVFVVGCRSVDVASQHSGPPPKCGFHGTQMQPEWIRVSPGEIVYMLAYFDVVKQQFPRHGVSIMSGERQFGYAFERRVRDFVCPDCTYAYKMYWKENAHK